MKLSIKKIGFTSFVISLFLLAPAWSLAKNKKEKTPLPAFVEVVTIKPVIWQPRIEAIGTLKAEQGVTLKSEVAGRVTHIFFKSNQMVNKGDPLIQLNSDILKAQKHSYDSNLTLKKLDYDRFKALHKKGVASETEHDKATAEYKSAEAQVEKAEAELEQTMIRAPFSGQVGLNLVDVGEYVTAGTSIVSLQDIEPMFVNFYVPEVYLGKFKVGDAVDLQVEAYKDKVFQGKVLALDNYVDPQSRMLEVRAQIPNPERMLFPGMFAEITLYLGDKKSVIMAPKTAIVATEKGSIVYKIINQIAVRTPVVTGEGDEHSILIKEGLKEGDIVVTAGQLKLKDGSSVVIANATPQELSSAMGDFKGEKHSSSPYKASANSLRAQRK